MHRPPPIFTLFPYTTLFRSINSRLIYRGRFGFMDTNGNLVLDEGDKYAPGYADRKSTRLNSSHVAISYAVFCLKKKQQRAGKQPVVKVNEPHKAQKNK